MVISNTNTNIFNNEFYMAIEEIINHPPPLHLLKNADGTDFSLEKHKGHRVVIYFYPKDNTTGCTKQACDLRDLSNEFKKRSCLIFGISKDDTLSHQRFSSKFNLNFPLLTDVSGEFCEAFGVWKQKSMYGKVYFGIERSTFYIDDSFIIRHIWRKVKVPGHWDSVLRTIDSL
jgi:peroxiredoxin Q/BCP